MRGAIFDCLHWQGWGAAGIWWVEAAKYPAMHRTAPHNEEFYPVQNVKRAEVEKPGGGINENILAMKSTNNRNR